MPVFHYVNGEIKTESEAFINVLDLGLLRGYGVFDYAQLYKGAPFHLREHIERLKRSADQIQLDLPMSLDKIEETALSVIERNESIDAGLRLIITGGLAGKDFLLPCRNSSLIILFHPFTPYKEEYYRLGMKAITTPTLRYLPHVKTTNYMPAIFGMRAAIEKDAQDALYLSSQGGILEGTTSNIFFIKDGMLITDNSEQIVKGVTREIILNIAQHHYPIEYRALHLSEVESCTEAFLTSSVKDVMPLVQIDGINVGNGRPGLISEHLRSLYHTYIEAYLKNNVHLTKGIV